MNPNDDPNHAEPIPPSDELLERYLARRCTEEEIAQVEAWLDQDVSRRDAVHALQRVLSDVPHFDTTAMLGRVRARIQRADRRPIPWPITPRSSRLPAVLGIAATILVVVGLAWTTRAAKVTPVVAAATPMREVLTRRGQQATLDLTDGSRVILAPASRLRIPADYNRLGAKGARRDLYLEGKAYFRVQHDSTRPFVVHTTTAITEDIGTEFVVNAYAESHATQVAVVSGVVTLRQPHVGPVASTGRDPSQSSDGEPLLVLSKGEVASLDTAGTATLAHNARIASYVAWTQGALSFDDAPIQEALAELGRLYDVDFRLTGGASDTRHITGEFRNESLDEAIQQMALMLDARAARNDRSVVFSPRTPDEQPRRRD